MANSKNNELISLLIQAGTITDEQADQIVDYANNHGVTPSEAIIQSGVLEDERELIKEVCSIVNYRYIDIRDVNIDGDIARLLTQAQAQSLFALPILEEEGRLVVAVPFDKVKAIQLKDDLRRLTNHPFIDLVVSTKGDIAAGINRMFRVDAQLQELSVQAGSIVSSQNGDNNGEIPEELNEESQVIRFVDLVIGQGIKDRASDIHFNPEEEKLQIRYRIDGILQEVSEAPAFMMKEIVSRVKIMAKLDISTTLVPQDGRLTVNTTDGRKIDLRVATLPSVWGEKVVMRILDNSNAKKSLEKLDFTPENLEKFRAASHKKFGMVLVTGPTGSGKSTTLYSALNEINSPEINVITVEDPVEYQIKGITQVAVNVKQKLFFGTVLRTVLRADPDVILVGEIRDRETAEIAMQAGLTGHMVFSTLHTNDAASALSRLIEMKVEPFIISSTLAAVVSQRLVRRLCNRCKEAYVATETELESTKFPHEEGEEITLYKAVGCRSCNFKGYSGRLGIHEVLVISDDMREKIIEGAKSFELEKLALADGMVPIQQDGFRKVREGLTTIEEILKAVE